METPRTRSMFDDTVFVKGIVCSPYRVRIPYQIQPSYECSFNILQLGSVFSFDLFALLQSVPTKFEMSPRCDVPSSSICWSDICKTHQFPSPSSSDSVSLHSSSSKPSDFINCIAASAARLQTSRALLETPNVSS